MLGLRCEWIVSHGNAARIWIKKDHDAWMYSSFKDILGLAYTLLVESGKALCVCSWQTWFESVRFYVLHLKTLWYSVSAEISFTLAAMKVYYLGGTRASEGVIEYSSILPIQIAWTSLHYRFTLKEVSTRQATAKFITIDRSRSVLQIIRSRKRAELYVVFSATYLFQPYGCCSSALQPKPTLKGDRHIWITLPNLNGNNKRRREREHRLALVS